MPSPLGNEQKWLTVGSLMVIATVALAVALKYTEVVMVPFVLAIFLTTVVTPAVDFLVIRWKTPQSLALVLALILVVLYLCAVGLLLIVAVSSIVSTAGELSDTIAGMAKESFGWLDSWLDGHWKIKIKTDDITTELQQKIPVIVSQLMGTGTSLVANGFMIAFFVVFLLAGRNSMQTRVGIYSQIESVVRRYIITKFVISAVTGLIVWWVLYMFGLRMPFVFGLLAFLLNFIPSIGSIIATFLPLSMALAQHIGFWNIVGVVTIPGVVQLVIGNVIEPKLMGRGLQLHPVTILLSLAFWGLLWGYMGMILAVPITAIIRIVLIRYDTTRALGNLLGGILPDHDIIVPDAKTIF
jgi:AI-2 transport protein TqsA